MRSIFLCSKPDAVARVYGSDTLAALREEAMLSDDVVTAADLRANPGAYQDVTYAFSTWGCPALTGDEIAAYLPSLRAVFYGAGTVQSFARPFLHRGVRIFSAWQANAVPVAEYTTAQIVLANKGFYASSRVMRQQGRGKAGETASRYPGNFETKVGLIGIGMIGSMVAQRLRQYHLTVLAFDKFLPQERAEQLGITLVSLDTLFRECGVVSNHLANLPPTRGMLRGEHFAALPPYATFINTGRGAQVMEEELLPVLEKRQDITAILDVTNPEPPVEGSPFYTLENVILTPHIAGSSGNEVRRMGEYMLAEFRRVERGEAPLYEVNEKMLETMA